MRMKKNINLRIGDEYQILRTNVLRIVWQTVRRMTRDLGVERISHFLYLFLSKTIKPFLVGKTKEFSNFKNLVGSFCRKQNWLFSKTFPAKMRRVQTRAWADMHFFTIGKPYFKVFSCLIMLTFDNRIHLVFFFVDVWRKLRTILSLFFYRWRFFLWWRSFTGWKIQQVCETNWCRTRTRTRTRKRSKSYRSSTGTCGYVALGVVVKSAGLFLFSADTSQENRV